MADDLPSLLPGNPSIDYFVSSELMEGRDRTLSSAEEEAYTEQVDSSQVMENTMLV